MPRDYYEVLGVGRDAASRDQEGLPRSGPRTAPRRQRPRPRGRGEVQGGGRGLRGALRRRAAPHLRRLRPRGLRSGGFDPGAGFGSIDDIFQAFFGGGGSASAASGRRGGDILSRSSRARRGRDRRAARDHLRRRRRLRALPRQRRRAGDADLHLRALRRRRPAAPGVRRRSARWSGGRLRRLRRRRQNPETPCECGGSGRTRGRRPAVEIPAGIETASGCGSPAPATPASRGAAGDLYVEVGSPRTSASSATAPT